MTVTEFVLNFIFELCMLACLLKSKSFFNLIFLKKIRTLIDNIFLKLHVNKNVYVNYISDNYFLSLKVFDENSN